MYPDKIPYCRVFDRHERIYVHGNCCCAPGAFCEPVGILADTDEDWRIEERNVAAEIPEQVRYPEIRRQVVLSITAKYPQASIKTVRMCGSEVAVRPSLLEVIRVEAFLVVSYSSPSRVSNFTHLLDSQASH